jgi:hypothetical protein
LFLTSSSAILFGCGPGLTNIKRQHSSKPWPLPAMRFDTMLIKIKRQDCLDKYLKFPLSEYNSKSDEEVFSYPKIFALYWLKLEPKSAKGLTKLLATELTRLLKDLSIVELIFLAERKRPWITKLSLERSDYKPVKDAVKYFMDNKIGRRFNGGIQIDSKELNVFFQHFYCLTRCDASFPSIHFMDKGQNIIGLIHYSGEVKFMTLNMKADKLFLDAIIKSKFLHTYRKGTNRISSDKEAQQAT